jgi:hypothetical protein
VAGPACQWPTFAHSRVSWPTRARERSGGVVTTRHRRHSWPPATPPPRAAHVATAPCALISRCCGPEEKHLPPTSTPPRASAAPLPCCRLLPSAVRTSRRQAPTPHPRPRLHLPEHHRALGYLTDLSFLTDECPSNPSPELSLPPSSTPPRAHTGEPPSVQMPKLGSSSSRACATAVSSPSPAVGRSDFTGDPPASGGRISPPLLPRPGQNTEEGGAVYTEQAEASLHLAVGCQPRPSQKPEQAKPKCTVHFIHFL